jgi:hypothetical protein
MLHWKYPKVFGELGCVLSPGFSNEIYTYAQSQNKIKVKSTSCAVLTESADIGRFKQNGDF